MKNRYILSPILFLGLIILIANNCKKEPEKDPGELPVVLTLPITDITDSSATCGGQITSNGGSAIITSGVCMSIGENPTADGFRIVNRNDTGIYYCKFKNLEDSKKYYARAFAINSVGTGYGSEYSFTTKKLILRDIDGNIYKTIKIGNKSWMAENLKVKHYRNGDPIETTHDLSLDIISENKPKYQWAYNGLESNADIYGRLYTWYTIADDRHVCPNGWRVSSEDDRANLFDEVQIIDYNITNVLREEGNIHWDKTKDSVGDTELTNKSGFTALPGGFRAFSGGFADLGLQCYFWSSDSSSNILAKFWKFKINALEYALPGIGGDNKANGYSVRCVRDY